LTEDSRHEAFNRAACRRRGADLLARAEWLACHHGIGGSPGCPSEHSHEFPVILNGSQSYMRELSSKTLLSAYDRDANGT
jgi:hypothetical protein